MFISRRIHWLGNRINDNISIVTIISYGTYKYSSLCFFKSCLAQIRKYRIYYKEHTSAIFFWAKKDYMSDPLRKSWEKLRTRYIVVYLPSRYTTWDQCRFNVNWSHNVEMTSCDWAGWQNEYDTVPDIHLTIVVDDYSRTWFTWRSALNMDAPFPTNVRHMVRFLCDAAMCRAVWPFSVSIMSITTNGTEIG